MRKIFKIKIEELFSDNDTIKSLSDLTDYEEILKKYGVYFFDIFETTTSDRLIVEDMKKINCSYKDIVKYKKECLYDIISENFVDDIRKKILMESDNLDNFFKEVIVMIGNKNYCYSMEDSLLYIPFQEGVYKSKNVISTKKDIINKQISPDDVDTIIFDFDMHSFKKIVEQKHIEMNWNKDWMKVCKDSVYVYINNQLQKLKNSISLEEILNEYIIKMEDEWVDLL